MPSGSRRPCRFLLDPSTPNARGPNGEPLWWCACGQGTFSSARRLRLHIVAERLRSACLWLAGTAGVAAAGSLCCWAVYSGLWPVVAAAAVVCLLSWWWPVATTSRQQPAPAAPPAPTQPPAYDPSHAQCLRDDAFGATKRQSACLFARSAKLWGDRSTPEATTTEQRVVASLDAFCTFARESAARSLDGFVFEVPDGAVTLENHARSVLCVLCTLSDNDPSGSGCLADPEHVCGRTWSFRWDGRHFFVSSFGGCYPPSHPRHAFGSTSSSFVLVQPGESFTRWKTAPHKAAILRAFEARGSPVFYQGSPNAVQVVPPLGPGRGSERPALVRATHESLQASRAAG